MNRAVRIQTEQGWVTMTVHDEAVSPGAPVRRGRAIPVPEQIRAQRQRAETAIAHLRAVLNTDTSNAELEAAVVAANLWLEGQP